MPLNTAFSELAGAMDGALVTAMNDAISGGIGAVRPQVSVMLGLYIVGHGVGTVWGHTTTKEAMVAIARAAIIIALLTAENYNYYVTELFFTTIPNEIAGAIHGGMRVSLDSAKTFDVTWDGVLHFKGFALGLATSWWDWDYRMGIQFYCWIIYASLWVDFVVWEVSRVFMALTIPIGPFIIMGYMWNGTRGFVQQWIGKLVGLSIIGLVSSILLRFLFVQMGIQLAHLKYEPKLGLDVVSDSLSVAVGVFVCGAILMMVIPAAFAFGAGSVGGAIAGTAAGLLSAGGQAAGSLGRALAGEIRKATRKRS
jgi:type IV secretion system protein VirB6